MERHGEDPSGLDRPDPSAAGIDPAGCLETLDASLAPIAAAGCAACGGRCCRDAGGSRAFIDREVLRRYLGAHPGATPETFVEDYLGRIPPLVCGESCVYHTPRGCALPAGMRSLTCNQFYCGNLRDLFGLCRRRGPDLVVLAVRIDRRKICSCVLLSARGFEVVEEPSPSRDPSGS